MEIMEAPTPIGRKITYQEFLSRCDERNAAEWVNGDVIYMTVSAEHSDIHSWLTGLFRGYLDHYKSGRAFFDPFQMKTGPNLPGRAPDVAVLLNENLHRLRRNHIEGPADLAVEVVSPESIGRDRGDKFVEYEAGGVLEYWIIDPARKQADFYIRGDDGYFHAKLPDGNGIYRSAILDKLWIDVEWLVTEPLPTLMDVFRAWNLS